MEPIVFPFSQTEANGGSIGEERLHIAVHVQADVLPPGVARRKATGWLLWNVGNLLCAEHPELILGETLLWRLDVYVTYPRLDLPGTGTTHRIGQIHLNAVTGEAIVSETFPAELIDDKIL